MKTCHTQTGLKEDNTTNRVSRRRKINSHIGDSRRCAIPRKSSAENLSLSQTWTIRIVGRCCTRSSRLQKCSCINYGNHGHDFIAHYVLTPPQTFNRHRRTVVCIKNALLLLQCIERNVNHDMNMHHVSMRSAVWINVCFNHCCTLRIVDLNPLKSNLNIMHDHVMKTLQLHCIA